MNIDKRILIRRLQEIKSKTCFKKIFVIVHNASIPYSTNNNGVFFNISDLNDNDITEIEQIISYYEYIMLGKINEQKKRNN